MALIISAQSGAWSAPATWFGGVVPGLGDHAVPQATHTVTVDAPTTVGDGVDSVTVEGTLINNVSLTLNGDAHIGNGTGLDGTLTYGPGSTLDLGAFNMYLNNCALTTTTTSGNWAYLTGTGSILKGAVFSNVKQSVVLRYVSMQHTGAVEFRAGNIFGALTSLIDVRNCTFVGCGPLTFGGASQLDNAADVIILDNDFRDLAGNILFTGRSTTTTGFSLIDGNTFYCSVTERTYSLSSRTNWTWTNNIVYGMSQGASTSGGWDFGGNFLARLSTAAGGATYIAIRDTEVGSTFDNNYLYSDFGNPHYIVTSNPGTAAGSTHYFTNNIFEHEDIGDQGNCISAGDQSQVVSGNIIVGHDQLSNRVGSGGIPGITVTISQNTCVVKTAATGVLWKTEGTGVTFAGDIVLHSNLVYPRTGTITNAVYCTDPLTPQAVLFSDNNDFHNTVTPYENVTVAGGQTSDIAVDPQFADVSRTISTWDASLGGPGTPANAIGRLLLRNGYNAGTKIQSDAPETDYLQSDLMAYIRAGLIPRETALVAGGLGGIYIGAVEPAPVSIGRRYYYY